MRTKKSSNIIFADTSNDYPLSYQVCFKFVKNLSILDKVEYVDFVVDWIYNFSLHNNVQVYDIFVESTYVAFKVNTHLNLDLKKFLNTIARKLLQDLDAGFDNIQLYDRFVKKYKRNAYAYTLLWHKPYFVRTIDANTQKLFIEYI